MAGLVRAPVHRALTRPQMFMGVTFNYFIINAIVTVEAFLIFRNWIILPIAVIMYLVGYFACLRAALADTGAIAVREDTNLEPGFWA